jgi:dihydropteroate synthase
MGVLNLTPDSFFDGGLYLEPKLALSRARQLVADGASIIDVGAESTRPGAKTLSVAEEIARLTPVVAELCRQPDSPTLISIDTRKSKVAAAMLELGADMINDVSALQFDPKVAAIVAKHDAWLVLSHSFGVPQTMSQELQERQDVVRDVLEDLRVSIALALRQGVSRDKLIVDPGFGFGKSYEQNLQILSQLSRFKEFGCPIMAGLSRKKTTGIVLQKKFGLAEVPDTNQRLLPSLAAHLLAVERGATIIRTHDVREQREVLACLEALQDVE